MLRNRYIRGSIPVAQWTYSDWSLIIFRHIKGKTRITLKSAIALRIFSIASHNRRRLCGLVVRVPGYRSRGPGFDFRRYQIFCEVVGLERGPLSLVRITEELLEWKNNDSRLENRDLTTVGCLQPPAHTGSSFADFSTLKMEAIRSSETSVHTSSTRRTSQKTAFFIVTAVKTSNQRIKIMFVKVVLQLTWLNESLL
jgi:hypothetical protein